MKILKYLYIFQNKLLLRILVETYSFFSKKVATKPKIFVEICSIVFREILSRKVAVLE
jgi:hypothetical protein